MEIFRKIQTEAYKAMKETPRKTSVSHVLGFSGAKGLRKVKIRFERTKSYRKKTAEVDS